MIAMMNIWNCVYNQKNYFDPAHPTKILLGQLSPNIAHGKRFKLIKHELLTPSPCCWVILNCFKPEKNWIIISTRLVGLQFTVPFRIIRIIQYNVKMEISAKLKARHVQIHIFHTKQNRIPWCHEYWKWSSQIQSDRLLSAGCAK